jgi:hypothetical protein
MKTNASRESRKDFPEDLMLRTACLIALWIARIVLGVRGAAPGFLLLTDIGIIGTHVWATMPLRRKLGKKYGLAPSWTGVLEVPMGIAILLGAFDLVHALR